jgi:hypothetical protein
MAFNFSPTPSLLQGFQTGSNFIDQIMRRRMAQRQQDMTEQQQQRQKQFDPLKKQLMEAQIQEATIKTQKNKQNMELLQKALQQMSGGAIGGDPNMTEGQYDSQKSVLQPVNQQQMPGVQAGESNASIPNSDDEWEQLSKKSGYGALSEPISQKTQLQNMIASQLGHKVERKIEDGVEYNYNPLFGTSQRRVGMNPLQKQLAGKDAGIISDLEKDALAIQPTINTLGELKNVVNSDTYKNLTNIPFYRGKQLSVLAKTGTPEQQDVIGRFNSLSGEIVKNLSREFKGPFRVGEQALAERMKPSENDTPQTAMAKIDMLMKLTDLNQKMMSMVPQLMREHSISSTHAHEIAKKQLGVKDFINNVNNQLKTINKPQKQSFNFDKFKVVE